MHALLRTTVSPRAALRTACRRLTDDQRPAPLSPLGAVDLVLEASGRCETISYMPYKDPETQRAYKREWTRMRRAGDCGTPSGTKVPVEFRLRTAADVLALLEEQVELVRGDSEAGTLEKARCVGYLAGISLKAIEAGDIAGRVEALEAVLKERRA